MSNRTVDLTKQQQFIDVNGSDANFNNTINIQLLEGQYEIAFIIKLTRRRTTDPIYTRYTKFC